MDKDEGSRTDRRRTLSDEDVKRIAEAVLDMVSLQVGKSLLKHLGWFIASVVAAVLIWIGKEHIDLK